MLGSVQECGGIRRDSVDAGDGDIVGCVTDCSWSSTGAGLEGEGESVSTRTPRNCPKSSREIVVWIESAGLCSYGELQHEGRSQCDSSSVSCSATLRAFIGLI